MIIGAKVINNTKYCTKHGTIYLIRSKDRTISGRQRRLARKRNRDRAKGLYAF